MTQDKAANYRVMLAYLSDLGADLAGHEEATLALERASSLVEMDTRDLLHYQTVLEATIDNRNELMSVAAMKEELTEVVRERLARGAVRARASETRSFRARIAHMEQTRYTHRRMAGHFVAIIDHQGHIYQGDSRDTDALCGHDWGETYKLGSDEDRFTPTNGFWVGGYDDPNGTLASVRKVAADHNIGVCPNCAKQAEVFE